VPKPPHDKAGKRSHDRDAERPERYSDVDGDWPSGAPGRGAREVLGPSSRVNVAFPFSQIRLQEPSKELSELAALVVDLVVTMAEWVPEDRLEELRARAQAVRDSLR
jgi:hypothetical protein